MAATLIEEGHVRLNRTKVTKPGHILRIDDVLTIAIGDHIRVLRIKDLGTRRGPLRKHASYTKTSHLPLHATKKTVHKAEIIAKHRSL